MTQGLISIVQDGKVVMKIITGVDGESTLKVAKAFSKHGRVLGLEKAYELAAKNGFNQEDSLVVMDTKATFHKIDADDIEVNYRKTFSDPKFNPRWDRGTADYTQIVHL